VTLALLQVLQFPAQAVQFPEAKIKLSMHFVQTVSDVQVEHPGSHCRQTPEDKKYLASHSVQT